MKCINPGFLKCRATLNSGFGRTCFHGEATPKYCPYPYVKIEAPDAKQQQLEKEWGDLSEKKMLIRDIDWGHSVFESIQAKEVFIPKEWKHRHVTLEDRKSTFCLPDKSVEKQKFPYEKFKVVVANGSESEAVQQIAFKMGYFWRSGDTTVLEDVPGIKQIAFSALGLTYCTHLCKLKTCYQGPCSKRLLPTFTVFDFVKLVNSIK
jgi:hypothetical protein